MAISNHLWTSLQCTLISYSLGRVFVYALHISWQNHNTHTTRVSKQGGKKNKQKQCTICGNFYGIFHLPTFFFMSFIFLPKKCQLCGKLINLFNNALFTVILWRFRCSFALLMFSSGSRFYCCCYRRRTLDFIWMFRPRRHSSCQQNVLLLFFASATEVR